MFLHNAGISIAQIARGFKTTRQTMMRVHLKRTKSFSITPEILHDHFEIRCRCARCGHCRRVRCRAPSATRAPGRAGRP
ncbi:helix-turn-helix domain-containing protein [Paraburkholderia solitsugae]|uniref:helix-turn-helix domain-containing protein n=1 Tax=Paraburkholderia solitsugae TaxID=2675748 RepID=UPI001555E489